jgi:hypothetical protein
VSPFGERLEKQKDTYSIAGQSVQPGGGSQDGVKPPLFQFSQVRKRRHLAPLRKLEKWRFDPILNFG